MSSIGKKMMSVITWLAVWQMLTTVYGQDMPCAIPPCPSLKTSTQQATTITEVTTVTTAMSTTRTRQSTRVYSSTSTTMRSTVVSTTVAPTTSVVTTRVPTTETPTTIIENVTTVFCTTTESMETTDVPTTKTSVPTTQTELSPTSTEVAIVSRSAELKWLYTLILLPVMVLLFIGYRFRLTIYKPRSRRRRERFPMTDIEQQPENVLVDIGIVYTVDQTEC